MEAKDTVMNDEAMCSLMDLDTEFTYPCSDGSQTITIDCHKLAQVQAEISFKEGIKEVVKWLENESGFGIPKALTSQSQEEWQAKLKEWGVEQK